MSASGDKAHWMLFALFLAILIVLGITLTLPEPNSAKGVVHTEFASMSEGGSSEHHDGRLVLGWIYGSLQILLFSACFYFAVAADRSRRGWILISGVLYLVVFAWLMISYGRGLEGAPIVLGFPLQTTLLIFGMWPVSALFALLYVIAYSKWIYSEDDAKKFEALKQKLAEKQRNAE